MKAKEPRGGDWIRIRHPLGLAAWVWRERVLVTSQLADMKAPDGSGDVIPQWLVAISSRGRRPKDHEVRHALISFGMEEAEEDNHHPGIARHFFLPVDPSRRVDCECKSDETVVVERDGYRWSNTTEGPCRGCEMERMRAALGSTPIPCPIHAAETTRPRE